MSDFQPPHQPDPGQPYPGQPYPGSPPPAGPVPLDQPFYGAGFLAAVTRFWRKYATVTGRASRSEFWWWQLANLVVAGVLGVITSAIATATALGGAEPIYGLTRLTRSVPLAAAIPARVWALAVLVPTVALTIRRLHDTDRSGWWYLLAVPAQLYSWVTVFVPVSRFMPDATVPGGLPVFPEALWVFVGLSVVTGAGSLVVLILCIFAPRPGGVRFDRQPAGR